MKFRNLQNQYSPFDVYSSPRSGNSTSGTDPLGLALSKWKFLNSQISVMANDARSTDTALEWNFIPPLIFFLFIGKPDITSEVSNNKFLWFYCNEAHWSKKGI